MTETYVQTRNRLEDYFDRTASATWTRLTSNAPVSRIRQTVREGRDRMRASLLSRLPNDLHGAHVLDAGCGAGQTALELAERGARVTAVDISPSLLDVARRRTPDPLQSRIRYVSGDMLDAALGTFDYVVAMDSLIHYRPDHVAGALNRLAVRTRSRIVFTIAPKTPLLSAMHFAGKAFPRSDRSPAIVPVSRERLARELSAKTGETPAVRPMNLSAIERVNSGFYISQAMELCR